MNGLQLQSAGFALASAAPAWRGLVSSDWQAWSMAFALVAVAFACLLGDLLTNDYPKID